MERMSNGIRVAVIGLGKSSHLCHQSTCTDHIGPAGLVAVKNLAEEGFQVTGFDRNSYVGGLWQYNEADQTSVMETTVVNISRERVRTFPSVAVSKRDADKTIGMFH